MKKFKWIIWIVLVALAGTGIWFWKFNTKEAAIELETVQPAYGTLVNTITATGTIQPVDTVAVGTQVSGTIQNVYVDFNSAVKKGQLLAQLDKSVLQAQVQQYNANLQQAAANLVYQEGNYRRQEQLHQAGAVSKADLENALYLYKSAAASVASIKAQLASAEKNLSYADIYSPIDGTVLSRSVSAGQTVAASLSTPTLFSIARDLTKMQVQASVDEADIGNVKTGQRVMFTVDAFPNDTFAGTVKEIRLRSSVSSNVVTYTTIVEAPNGSGKLKPGMTASITIYTREIENILLLPAQALAFQPDSVLAKVYRVTAGGSKLQAASLPQDTVQRPGGTPAWVWVKQDSSLTRRQVMTGSTDETKVQVLSGLDPGDLVVTGYHTIENKQAGSGKAASSPFMPKPPGNSNKKNNSPPGPPQ